MANKLDEKLELDATIYGIEKLQKMAAEAQEMFPGDGKKQMLFLAVAIQNMNGVFESMVSMMEMNQVKQ
ncbi:hypothetical protein D3C87_125410 [compost metagenome]